MRNITTYLLIIILITSCKENSQYYEHDYNHDIKEETVNINMDYMHNYYGQTDGYSDGIYCAEVEYYNPLTGTRSTYYLDVEVEEGELTVIYWPNSGWLDDSHFYPEVITDGICQFTSDRGYEYTIILKESGGCGYTDDYKIRNDIMNDTEQITCPKCGEEIYNYDDICDNCNSLLEDEN